MCNRPLALTGGPAVATVPTAAVATAAVATGAAVTRQQGFSLLEMLVALIVIVLVTSLASLTINSGGQDLQLEAAVRNLADAGGYALDEAQMNAVDYGLLIEEEEAAGETVYSYRWLERYIDQARRLEEWREPASGKDVFARQQLPPGVALELELEDAPEVELSVDEKKKKEEGISPQVVFYSSGEATVGAINVRQQASGDLLWRVEWDLLGRFSVLRRGVPDEEGEGEEDN
jgi:general secretion pathway protein H